LPPIHDSAFGIQVAAGDDAISTAAVAFRRNGRVLVAMYDPHLQRDAKATPRCAINFRNKIRVVIGKRVAVE